jgi:hypothetical protein
MLPAGEALEVEVASVAVLQPLRLLPHLEHSFTSET